MKKAIAVLLIFLSLSVSYSVFAASSETGIVLLHGKWGSPKGLAPLERELESRGYLVSNPEMPWSGRRMYDVDYPAALKEIEKEAAALRARGAKHVIVAGQSMGSNAAVAYAASGYEVDGLVIMSPGHFPEGGMGRRLRASIERAKNSVAANRSKDTESFDDINQGKQRSVRVPAGTYFSYFDPDGLGALTKTIQKLPKPIPVFLAIGTGDPFLSESKSFFDSAPTHPLSRYLTLQTDHFDLPKVVAPELLKWLALLETAGDRPVTPTANF
ncbi:MAG TPA: alpha/beta hydrolase [Candidatus Binatia bacterium]